MKKNEASRFNINKQKYQVNIGQKMLTISSLKGTIKSPPRKEVIQIKALLKDILASTAGVIAEAIIKWLLNK